jgi:hypothetical protein
MNSHPLVDEYAKSLFVALGSPLDDLLAVFNNAWTVKDESAVLAALRNIGEWAVTVISIVEFLELTESDLFVDLSQSQAMCNAFLQIL